MPWNKYPSVFDDDVSISNDKVHIRKVVKVNVRIAVNDRDIGKLSRLYRSQLVIHIEDLRARLCGGDEGLCNGVPGLERYANCVM